MLEELRCTNQDLRKLARSRQLGRVGRLGLRARVPLGKFDADGVIARVDALPIEELDLTGGAYSPSFGALGNAAAASRLVRLELTAGTCRWPGRPCHGARSRPRGRPRPRE